jgi:hypothetical protein
MQTWDLLSAIEIVIILEKSTDVHHRTVARTCAH